MSWIQKTKVADDSRPKLAHKRVSVKMGEDGVCRFMWYDSEAKTEEEVKSISGALIGKCYVLEQYDNSLKKTWRSNYVFDNNNVMIFSPIDGKKAFDKPISYKDAKAWLTAKVGGAKSKYVYWVYDLDSCVLYAVYSNISIAIDQSNRYKKEIGNGNRITLNPEEYSQNTQISTATKEMLGKVALKNKPNFANISFSNDPITDEEAETSGLMDIIDKFNEYSKVTVAAKVENAEPTNRMSNMDNFYRETAEMNAAASSDDDNEDDLPF
jgi:hypothetical protein